jgi:hypothetical protein
MITRLLSLAMPYGDIGPESSLATYALPVVTNTFALRRCLIRSISFRLIRQRRGLRSGGVRIGVSTIGIKFWKRRRVSMHQAGIRGAWCAYRKRANAAIPSATASSSRAAGKSCPNVFAQPERPIARPHRALVTILVMNCVGINRLGVYGSLSLTSSPIAMRVKK